LNLRADTYLWAIRLFKSRTLASDAIKSGKVKLEEANLKPSHVVKVGEKYTINQGNGIKKIIEVSGLLEKRASFEIAKNYYNDLSPTPTIQEKAEKAFFVMNVSNERGSGRPTKRNRRNLEDLGGWF
jgi:ribosome-associated heat shock protein Hsp15